MIGCKDVCVYVCVCDRDRGRERISETVYGGGGNHNFFLSPKGKVLYGLTN